MGRHLVLASMLVAGLVLAPAAYANGLPPAGDTYYHVDSFFDIFAAIPFTFNADGDTIVRRSNQLTLQSRSICGPDVRALGRCTASSSRPCPISRRTAFSMCFTRLISRR